MKGWKLFAHSVRQVFGNLGAAMRVSALLYAIQVVALFGFTGVTMFVSEAERQAMIAAGEFPWWGLMALMLVSIVTGLWIAVGWHRYILTEEQPGLLPPFHGERMLGYFGKGIEIGLILIVPLILTTLLVVVVILPLAKMGATTATTIVPYIMMLPVGVIGIRLSAMLPGAALGPDVPIGTGWSATKGETGAILVLVVIWALISGALNVIGTVAFGKTTIPAYAWATLVQWATLMISVSILTTLYGHYIEKRPLI